MSKRERFSSGKRRDTLRVRALALPEEVAQLRQVDLALGRQPVSNAWNASHWLVKNPRLVVALEDQSGRVWGRAACIPLREETFRLATAGGERIRQLLTPDNVLSTDEALARSLDGRGNQCLIGMTVCNPETRQEDNALAPPLMRELQSRFFGLRPRALVCRSSTFAQELLVASAGCEPVTTTRDEGGRLRTTWIFDRECAQRFPTSGFGLVFHSLWPSPAAPSSLGLTPTQRRIVFLTANGYPDAAAARSLAIAVGTVRKHWENVLARFRAHLGPESRATRERVIGFCQQHPIELHCSSAADAVDARGVRAVVQIARS